MDQRLMQVDTAVSDREQFIPVHKLGYCTLEWQVDSFADNNGAA